MGKAITAGLTSSMPVIGLVTRVVLGFFIVGVFVLWWIFGGLDFYVFMMLTPIFAPWVVQWAARRSEFYADRKTADLGYGVLLTDVFTYREAERAKAWASLPRQPKLGSRPLDSTPAAETRDGPQGRAGSQPSAFALTSARMSACQHPDTAPRSMVSSCSQRSRTSSSCSPRSAPTPGRNEPTSSAQRSTPFAA
jgi:hypothetical protein